MFLCFTVKAVYDVTLNFKDNQTPTLLGIVNGKKYKADMSVRSVVVLLALGWRSYCAWNESGLERIGADSVINAPTIPPVAFLTQQCSSESTVLKNITSR